MVQSNWICRLGSWLRWGSLFELAGLVVVLLAFPFVATGSEKAGDVMFAMLQAGFVLIAVTFLASLGCQMASSWVTRRTGGNR